MSTIRSSAGTLVYNPLLQPDLRLMLAEGDNEGLQQFCEVLNPVIVAEVLQGLDPADAWRVLSSTEIKHQAEIFEFIDPAQQIDLVASVDRKQLSSLVEAMSADDRVDLLSHMDDAQLEALLPLIAQAERDEIRRMLSYEENSAASIMTTEYASLPENITVSEALSRFRQQAPDSETIYYVFVVNEARHLHGVITLRELILARPGALLAEVMRRDVIAVRTDDDREKAARLIAKFDLIALPVLDEENRLVGIITHDDVLDVVQEEAEEDAYRQSAIQPLEHSYLSTPLLTIAWKRGVWLLVLSIMALGTATVMKAFGKAERDDNWLDWFLAAGSGQWRKHGISISHAGDPRHGHGGFVEERSDPYGISRVADGNDSGRCPRIVFMDSVAIAVFPRLDAGGCGVTNDRPGRHHGNSDRVAASDVL